KLCEASLRSYFCGEIIFYFHQTKQGNRLFQVQVTCVQLCLCFQSHHQQIHLPIPSPPSNSPSTSNPMNL
ncbi:hypothetical protein J4Q44_G00285710, partial [Coregonus suidteri]